MTGQGHLHYWGLLRLVCCWLVAVSLVTTLVLTSYIRPQISQSVGGSRLTDRLAFILSILCTLVSVVQQTDSWRPGKSIIVLYNLDKILVWLWLRNPTAISPSVQTICPVILGGIIYLKLSVLGCLELYGGWRLGLDMERQWGQRGDGWLCWPSHQTQFRPEALRPDLAANTI